MALGKHYAWADPWTVKRLSFPQIAMYGRGIKGEKPPRKSSKSKGTVKMTPEQYERFSRKRHG